MQTYTVYKNFNTAHCTNIANNAQAVALAHANCYNNAVNYANAQTANNVAVVYNKEGEAYYATNVA